MNILVLARAFLIPRTSLALENLALRQQVAVLKRSVPRPRVRLCDRIYWVVLRRIWSGWRDCLLFVRPSTVVRWHGHGWRLLWRWRSRGKPGRPAISIETRELIGRLSSENRFWGAPRIQAEIERLGERVAKSTVERYMVKRRGPPSGTWRAFLRNHAGEVLACDFFLVPTASFKALIGFVVMELDRRRIVACDVTSNPTASWAANVVRRAALSAGGRARYLLRDRDSIYGDAFKTVVRGLGLRQIVTAYHAPLQNAHVERLIGTIRRECLDHLIVMGEDHARRILEEFVRYYNEDRTHQALGAESPVLDDERGEPAGSCPFPTSAGSTTATGGPPEQRRKRLATWNSGAELCSSFSGARCRTCSQLVAIPQERRARGFREGQAAASDAPSGSLVNGSRAEDLNREPAGIG